MGSLKDFAERLSPLLGKKSVVDGKEFEHVFLVVGGLGFGEEERREADGKPGAGGGGGGGIVLPLGSYSVDEGQLRFHPNPVVLIWSSLYLVAMTSGLLRSLLKSRRRNAR